MRRAVIVLVILALAASLYGQTPDYQPPGRMMDVGGRRMHLHCSGSGNPTVVLEGGGGAFAIDWALVQPLVAGSTRICSYDRAGLGWSDRGPAYETVEQMVSDLHNLLRAADENGPFVLVGASIGGIYIRAYRRTYPDEVAALVFTNSSGRVGLITQSGGDLLWKLSENDIRSAYPLPASARPPRPVRTGQPSIVCQQIFSRFACGSTCACGRVSSRRPCCLTRCCHGAASFFVSSTKPMAIVCHSARCRSSSFRAGQWRAKPNARHATRPVRVSTF